MHRIAIIIEETHCAFLRKKSEQEKKSVSQVLREILDSCMEKSMAHSLSSLSGITEDAKCRGREHDKWLYEEKR
jgi:hypothetical protein